MRKLYQDMVLKKQQLDTKDADKPVQIQGLSRQRKEEPAEAVLV
jgi:hypothetical protein